MSELPLEHYTRNFVDHTISRRDEHSLLLRNPKCSNFWVTISSTDGGQLAVIGDVGPMVYSGGERGLLDKIAWIGGTDDVGYYVSQKASVGMSPFKVHNYTAEGWKEDVIKVFEGLPAGWGEPGDKKHDDLKSKLTWSNYLASADEDLIHNIGNETSWTVWSELEDFLNECGVEDCHEVIGDIGQRVEPTVLFCWAAVQKAYQLLKTEGAYDAKDSDPK